MSSETTTITVSGKAWSNAIAGSSVPGEEGWPIPTFRSCGAGFQAVYQVTEEQAVFIKTHLEDVGSSFVLATDPITRFDGRVCLLAASVIERRITKNRKSYH